MTEGGVWSLESDGRRGCGSGGRAGGRGSWSVGKICDMLEEMKSWIVCRVAWLLIDRCCRQCTQCTDSM